MPLTRITHPAHLALTGLLTACAPAPIDSAPPPTDPAACIDIDGLERIRLALARTIRFDASGRLADDTPEILAGVAESLRQLPAMRLGVEAYLVPPSDPTTQRRGEAITHEVVAALLARGVRPDRLIEFTRTDAPEHASRVRFVPQGSAFCGNDEPEPVDDRDHDGIPDPFDRCDGSAAPAAPVP